MLHLLLALLISTSADACALGADAWAAREAASRRVERLGVLGIPALSVAAQSADPEIRFRARRLLAPYACLTEDAPDAVLAAWLFYGPDESPPTGWNRPLSSTSRRWVARLGHGRMIRLLHLGGRWGLLWRGEAENVGDAESCLYLIELARHRAVVLQRD